MANMREADRYIKELDEKALTRGWTELKKKEVAGALLRSPEFQADENLKRPYVTKLKDWKQKLLLDAESLDFLAPCLLVNEALEATDRLLEIDSRQYKLAFTMLAQE